MKNYLALISIFTLFIGCAENRDVEQVRQGDRQNIALKTGFLGASNQREVWLAKTTVVDLSLIHI